MHKVSVTLLLTVILLLNARPMFAAGSRFAVLVGVGQYDPRTEVSGVVQSANPTFSINLKSPPNDLVLMNEVLSYYGFDDKNTVALSDANATRDGIINAVRTNLFTLPPGSLAVFYFSGHGSARKGTDSIGTWNDETIVPYDGRVKGQPARDIIDDEIYGWIEELSRKSITSVFIFDSCFSGGIARIGGTEEKFLPAVQDAVRPPRRDGVPSLRSGAVPSRQNAVVVLTASDADEPAQGTLFRDRYQGVFTTALRNVLLPTGRSPPPVKWSDAVAQMVASLKPSATERAIQSPHVYGAVDAKVFDSQGPFSHSIAAKRISPGQATMQAGSDLGVTEKSVFKLFGPGQVPWRSSETFEAQAKVTRVTPQSAELEVLAPGQLSSETLAAVEVEYAVPDYKVKVKLPPPGWIDPFDRAAIASEIGKLAAISDAAPELVISKVDRGWQLATVDGKQVGAPVGSGNSDALGVEIARRLADYVRWKRLIAWKRSGIGGTKLDYQVSYQTSDGTKVLEADQLQGSPIPAGSAIRLLVENRGTQKIKVDAVLLRQNFSIDVCPIGILGPRQEFATEQITLGTQAGQAAWKIVVSDPAQNISLLFLNSDSGARSASVSLEDEFARVWNGATSLARGSTAPDAYWRTIDVVFNVSASNDKSSAPGPERKCLGLPQN
jgi:hypothetical protein